MKAVCLVLALALASCAPWTFAADRMPPPTPPPVEVAGGPVPGQAPSPPGARLYFINLQDGQRLRSPFLVQFGLTGMGVAPFGLIGPGTQNTGHHHLIINAPPPAPGAPIPADERHLHFGAGQTEAMVTLPPGTHTLQLVLGDALHIPHVPPVMSERITVVVEP